MARGARNRAGLRLLGCLLLLGLAACHRHHDVHKQLGVLTDDAVATFRAICGVEPKREEGVLKFYEDVGGVLKGRDIVKLSCSDRDLVTKRELIYDRASHRLLQLTIEDIATNEFERVQQHIVIPVVDAEQRRAISRMKRALFEVDVRSLNARPNNQQVAFKSRNQGHVLIEFDLFPVEALQKRDPDGDGRDWSVRVWITE